MVVLLPTALIALALDVIREAERVVALSRGARMIVDRERWVALEVSVL